MSTDEQGAKRTGARAPTRRSVLHLAGLGALAELLRGAGRAEASAGPALAAPAQPRLAPAEAQSPLDVTQFGAAGDGTTDDTAAIQAALDTLRDGQGLTFPSGIYAISDTLSCRDRSMITLQSVGRAQLAARAGANLAGKALLDLSGSVRVQMLGLRIDSRNAASPPAVGLVLGRTATKGGHGGFFQSCMFEGRYTIATVYNAACEVVTFQNCLFQSETGNPAYWDSSTDSAGLTGVPGQSWSNSRKFFWACWFANYSGQPDSVIVGLRHYQYELAFRDCLFSLGSPPGWAGGYVFDLQGSEENSITRDLVLDNCRVEGADIASSRLIYVNMTHGLARLRLSNLVWEIQSEYLIELAKDLHDSDLWFPSTRGSFVKVNPGARLYTNRLYGALGGKILVDAGATARDNVVLSNTGTPYVGGGSFPAST